MSTAAFNALVGDLEYPMFIVTARAGDERTSRDVEYANLAMKLNQSGLPGTATINSITESGAGSDPVNKAYDIGVSVELENGQSYDTTIHQYLTQDAVNAYQPGGKFQIKADPDDTSKVMLYGQA